MARRSYIVAFDVADCKRRRRLVKLLQNYCYRVQYSVFECAVSEKEMSDMRCRIRTIISDKEDSVIIYGLSKKDRDSRVEIGKGAIENDEYRSDCVIIG